MVDRDVPTLERDKLHGCDFQVKSHSFHAHVVINTTSEEHPDYWVGNVTREVEVERVVRGWITVNPCFLHFRQM
jgi:hypothetical protein